MGQHVKRIDRQVHWPKLQSAGFTRYSRRWMPVLAALSFTGCGVDPIVGTWQGMIANLTDTYTFNADGTATHHTEFPYDMVPGGVSEGCVLVGIATGYEWRTLVSNGTPLLTLSHGPHYAYGYSVTMCSNAADNQPMMVVPATNEPPDILEYTVSGDVLTLGIRGSTTTLVYRRQ